MDRRLTGPAVESVWLEPGGTNRQMASDAVRTLYRSAGLDEPRIEWFESPRAALGAMGDVAAEQFLVHCADEFAARLKGSQDVHCLCATCMGMSVHRRLEPAARIPSIEIARTADAVTGTIFRGLDRDRTIAPNIAPYPHRPPLLIPGDEHHVARRQPRSEALPFGNQWLSAPAAAHTEKLASQKKRVTRSQVARRSLVLSAGWWWFYDGFAVLTDRPGTILFDDRDRLHGESGPAVAYPDGWSVNALGGIALPSWFRDPGAITPNMIMAERNLEVRRHLIGRFGAERFMKENHGELRDASEWGELWCCRSGPPWRRTAWFAMVHVVDATPQPDGTRRDYWISVPPETRTAHEAVAWTFGLDAESYDPVTQT